MLTDTVQILNDYNGFDVLMYARIEKDGSVLESFQIFDHETGEEMRGDYWFRSLQEAVDWINT